LGTKRKEKEEKGESRRDEGVKENGGVTRVTPDAAATEHRPPKFLFTIH
jgi:hypothetical protein